jgi:hypothetical protein
MIHKYPEHRILITINKLPIFLIDFDSIDFFDLIDFLVLNQLIFVLISFLIWDIDFWG